MGDVTLVLADFEGSVSRWVRGAGAVARFLRRFDALVSRCGERRGGARAAGQDAREGFVLAFSRAPDALACARDLQVALVREDWSGGLESRLRMAVHTGEVEPRDAGTYAGPAVDRCVRLCELARGGQVLVSKATRDLVGDRLPVGVGIRDLGVHALRDLARAEHVYLLTHPELSEDGGALAASGFPAANLPAQVTSLVGRARERVELAALLGETRTLTLTGAGGSGKTRLALAVAGDVLDDYPHGTWWVDLAPVGDPGVVATAVASAVGVQEQTGEDLVSALGRALGQRRLLLVLDNCEHVVQACATLADSLVRSCPDLTILATSREPLGVEGETTYRVPSLTVPEEGAELDELAAAEAVRLFVDRVRKVRPSFRLGDDHAEVVGRICRRLDGIPLAIELAAARVRMLTPTQIADALSDRFVLLTGGPRTALPRQRTLEASVEWSYDLLDEDSRAVLARLSVFAGSFALDGAEAVGADDGLPAHAVLDVLSGLVDRSLVQLDESTGEARYRLLETVRLYAQGRLVERGEIAVVRDRHLAYYLELARRGGAGLASDGYGTWLTLLGAELDNFRAAMDWAMATERPVTVIDMAVPLYRCWLVRGLFAEMHRRLRAAIDDPSVGPAARARALRSASILALMGGEYATGYALAAEAVPLAREHAGPNTLADALRNRSWAGFFSARSTDEEIWAGFEEACAIARGTGNPETLASAVLYMGTVERQGRSLTRGRAKIEQALELIRSEGLPYLALPAHAFAALTDATFAGQPDQARDHAEEALRLGRPLGEPAFVSMALGALAVADALRGDEASARGHLDEALRVARTAGLRTFLTLAHSRLALLECRFGDPNVAAEAARQALVDAHACSSAVEGALAYWLLGVAALRAGDGDAAREHLDTARAGSLDPRYGYCLGRALVGLSCLAEDEGDLERAWNLAHEGLDVLADYGDPLGTADALETVAGIAAHRGAPEQAARLLAAVEHHRQQTGIARFPLEAARLPDRLAAVRATLDADAFEACWVEGGALSAAEAVAYARRGRGQRARPATGWLSLTPSELDVTRLVAAGLDNPAIAERLFVSRNTVKTHLSHVYAKLGISSRAELAVEAARQGRDHPPG